VQTAKPPAAPTLAWRQTVPGLGTILRRVVWSARQDLVRFPRVPDGVSACRLVTGARASAGPRSGPAGTQSGPASRPWACSAAAVLCLRTHPAGHTSLAR